MKTSKQRLQQVANSTGFKMEYIEKVFLLMDLLSDFSTFPQLKNKIVLKGGTGLNLFFFNLPRLSVDIDLNYIGSVDRDTMLAERPVIQSAIEAICERNGLILDRSPNRHAGGKMVWRYQSVLGQMGNLEIDLNFMYRIPLWPIEYKSSCFVGGSQIHSIPILDIHELSAGKLCALIDRKTGRDLFDAYYLLTKLDVNFEKLRLALIIYSVISRKIDLRRIMPKDITVKINDLKNKLVPLLKKDEIKGGIDSITKWSANLVEQCQSAFSQLLPITEKEGVYLTNLLDNGIVQPELLSSDEVLIRNIHLHPAIKWSAQHSNK